MNLKTKRMICLLVGIASILTIVGTISYAYFTAMANINPVESVINTANVSVRFSDYGDEVGGQLKFGTSITKKFTIENTGTAESKIKMYWIDLINTYLKESLTYTLSYSENESGPYKEAVSKTNVPQSRYPSKEALADNLTIPVGKTYYYNLVITLNNLPDVDQTSDLNAIFNSKFGVEDINYVLPSSTLMAVNSIYDEKLWAHRNDIKQIVFEITLNPKANASYTYDISDAQDGSVMTYLVPDNQDNTKYITYIQANGSIKANENSFYLFSGFTNLESIENLSMLNTSNVTNMSYMFSNCNNISSLDLSSFNTSNVTNMEGMFYYCNNLIMLNINNFDTSKITNMGWMFQNCSKLTTLNLDNFKTNSVNDMSYMFYDCNNLLNLNINNFNTTNVTNMEGMFKNCNNLSNLNVNHFDTSNTTSMGWMFQSCNKLSTLNLENFNTSKVINMSYMFFDCTNLSTLNIKNWNVDKVTSKTDIFNEVSDSIKITVSNSTIKQWVINASNSPRLTTSNVVIG